MTTRGRNLTLPAKPVPQSPSKVSLRDVQPSDLAIFFEQEQDADANWMAAFTAEDPSDRAAFTAHWNKILSRPDITVKTILFDGKVAGSIASFKRDGVAEITYWLGKEYWGQGVATNALSEFLAEFAERPMQARVAKDNIGSQRVLQKCGFVVVGSEKGYANARGGEIEELILELPKPVAAPPVPRPAKPSPK